MATLRHNIANIVSTSFTMVSLSLKKILYPKSLFFTGIQRFSPGVVVDTDSKSKIKLNSCVSMHSRCRLVATCGGEVQIGCNTSFNVGCIVISRSRIEIGKNVSVGPNVMMYDHDHIMESGCGALGNGYRLGEIVIGDNCWIGAGTIILLGTHIGNNCVIAAGSIVKGEVPDNTVLIQKRTGMYKGVE